MEIRGRSPTGKSPIEAWGGHVPQSTLGTALGTAAPAWRIAIVEDHLMQRVLTRHVINSVPDLAVVFAGETLPEFTRWWETEPVERRPDLLLLDLLVDRGEPADPETVRRLVHAGLTVGIFSALSSPARVRKMLRAGASGVIGKRDTVEVVVQAVLHLLNGGTWMTPETAAIIAQDGARPQLSEQEERTLVLYASGLTLEAVADMIGVKRSTAAQYLKRVKEKYQAAGQPVSTKIELRTIALRDGFLDV